ncbi:MAG: hypothetical protein RL095_1914 [Verrucomicrobiota bacterium]
MQEEVQLDAAGRSRFLLSTASAFACFSVFVLASPWISALAFVILDQVPSCRDQAPWIAASCAALGAQILALALGIAFLHMLKLPWIRTTVPSKSCIRQVLYAYLIMLGALLLQLLSTAFCKQVLGLEQTEQHAIQQFTQCQILAPLAIPIFVLVATVGAPLMEEVIFRGLLYSGLRHQMNWLPAALVSAAIFAVIHFDPWQFLGLFGLGFAFAFVREKTGSLLLAMFLHASNNIFTVSIMLLLQERN